MTFQFNASGDHPEIPEGEYHLNLTFQNLLTGETKTETIVLHEGRAWQDLLQAGRDGIIDPRDPDSVELVAAILGELYNIGESSVVAISDTLEAMRISINGDTGDSTGNRPSGLRAF